MRTGHACRCRRGALGAAATLAAALVAAACVAVPDQDGRNPLKPDIEAVAVVIPLGTPTDPNERVLVEFYDSLLRRIQDAYRERDLAAMQTLVRQYRRDNLPEWVRDRFAGYAALCLGLEFELHGKATARIEQRAVDGMEPAARPPAGSPPAGSEIGDTVEFELVLPPLPEKPVRLGGLSDEDPVSFEVVVAIGDEFVDGSRRDDEDSAIVRLPATVVLGENGSQDPLRVPVRLQFPDSGAVRRTMDVRVDLLPGYVAMEAQRAPVRGATFVRTRLRQWPKGYLPIRDKPLVAMQAAMQIGDSAHFPHVWLAAVFAPVADRPKTEAMLIDWVRLGRPDQALVAMASLRATGAAQIQIGDRDGWLAWWQSRR